MISLAFYLVAMGFLVWLAFWVCVVGLIVVVRILILPFMLLTWIWETAENLIKRVKP